MIPLSIVGPTHRNVGRVARDNAFQFMFRVRHRAPRGRTSETFAAPLAWYDYRYTRTIMLPYKNDIGALWLKSPDMKENRSEKQCQYRSTRLLLLPQPASAVCISCLHQLFTSAVDISCLHQHFASVVCPFGSASVLKRLRQALTGAMNAR